MLFRKGQYINLKDQPESIVDGAEKQYRLFSPLVQLSKPSRGKSWKGSRGPRQSPDYLRIIHEKHFESLVQFLTTHNIISGGQTDRQDLYIAPTLLDDISWDDPIMRDEIFGPLLPVIGYDDLSEAISQVRKLPRPLALYFFSNNRQDQERILKEISFGGGCINDTLLHFASPYLPFGGVGSSGMGSYHGKASFDTFSHLKGILKKPLGFDIPLRYPPYKNKLKLLKKLMH